MGGVLISAVLRGSSYLADRLAERSGAVRAAIVAENRKK
jgi:hypothetical protein